MKGVADRLLDLLRSELQAFERFIKDKNPNMSEPAGLAGRARFEAIAQMTKTLEKLLDLKRLERLAAAPDAADDGEARRLRAEMMRRLKVLDARRIGGGGSLFSGADEPGR